MGFRAEAPVATVLAAAALAILLGTSLAAPVTTLPGWLRAWAEINPVTHTMDATRALLTGTPVGDAVTKSLVWSAIILVVFCPLAIRAYARKR